MVSGSSLSGVGHWPHWIEPTVELVTAVAPVATVLALVVAVVALCRSGNQFAKIKRDERVRQSLLILTALGSDEFRRRVEDADQAMSDFENARGGLEAISDREAFIRNTAAAIHLVLNVIESHRLELCHDIADIDVARMHFRRTLQDYWARYETYVRWFRETRQQPGAYSAFETVLRHLDDDGRS